MKFFATRLLAIFFLITFASAHNITANYETRNSDECCRTGCYECSCNPLYCGAFDLQFQIGVAPLLWEGRGTFNAVQCPGVSGNPAVFSLFDIPKFSHFYKVPWIVGGQIGYALSDNVRLYVEFDYVQARTKDNVSLVSLATPVATITFDSQKYRLVEGYVGGRYYWDRWCDRTSFFLGIKAGFVHHHQVEFNSLITPPVSPAVAPVAFTDLVLFNRNTVPSGGINVGLDFCFCGCWSLVLTAELVASCGPQSNPNIAFGQPNAGCSGLAPQPSLPALPNLNNLLIGHIGSELRFPITAAVRYSF